MKGQIYNNQVISVDTKKMSMVEYLSLDSKPLILYNGMVLCHITDDDFVISGISYGDCSDHYFKINTETVSVVVDAVVECRILSDLLSSPSQPGSVTRQKSKKLTYIMHDSATGLFKIGRSSNPSVREKTLQSEKPTIDLVSVFDMDIEAQLHEEYKDYRVRGEWFCLTWDMVLDAIKMYKM